MLCSNGLRGAHKGRDWPGWSLQRRAFVDRGQSAEGFCLSVQAVARGSSLMQPVGGRKSGSADAAVGTDAFVALAETDITPDDLFFHKYYSLQAAGGPRRRQQQKKKKKRHASDSEASDDDDSSDDSDAEIGESLRGERGGDPLASSQKSAGGGLHSGSGSQGPLCHSRRLWSGLCVRVCLV
jgi:hypothetical protein